MVRYFVGNKAKRLISKRVFQENKSTPNFPKNEPFLPPGTQTCVSKKQSTPNIPKKQTFLTPWYAHVRKIRFSENLACFVFLEHPFWDSPFYLITDDLRLFKRKASKFWQLSSSFLQVNLESRNMKLKIFKHGDSNNYRGAFRIQSTSKMESLIELALQKASS